MNLRSNKGRARAQRMEETRRKKLEKRFGKTVKKTTKKDGKG